MNGNTVDRTAPHDGITVADLIGPSGRCTGLLALDWTPMLRADRIASLAAQHDRERRAAEWSRSSKPRKAGAWRNVAVKVAAMLGIVW